MPMDLCVKNSTIREKKLTVILVIHKSVILIRNLGNFERYSNLHYINFIGLLFPTCHDFAANLNFFSRKTK